MLFRCQLVSYIIDVSVNIFVTAVLIVKFLPVRVICRTGTQRSCGSRAGSFINLISSGVNLFSLIRKNIFNIMQKKIQIINMKIPKLSIIFNPFILIVGPGHFCQATSSHAGLNLFQMFNNL